MNTNLVTNVSLLTVAMAAITKGLDLVSSSGSMVAGIITLIVGIAILVVYEKFPSTPTV